MDNSHIRNYDSNKDAPWYREYLVMSPALIIIVLVFGIFIKLICYRRWLTKEIETLASIEVPPLPAKMSKTTQTGYDPVVISYDGPSKIGKEESVVHIGSSPVGGAMYVEPICTPAMVDNFAI